MNLEDVLAAKAGDKDAMARLLKDNEGLIQKVVYRYCRRNGEVEDAMQAGRIGFMRGISRFDPERGTKPITIIFPHIRSAVQRNQINSSLIKVPAEGPILPDETVSEMRRRQYKLRRKVRPRNQPEDIPWSRLFVAKAPEDRDWKNHVWERFSEVLSSREYHIIEAIHKHGATHQEVGDELGVTHQRVSQIRDDITKRLFQIFYLGIPPGDQPPESRYHKVGRKKTSKQGAAQ